MFLCCYECSKKQTEIRVDELLNLIKMSSKYKL